MKVVAIAAKYARPDGTREIGGVETYLTQLARALKGTCEVVVCHPAERDFEVVFPELRVVGRRTSSYQALTDHVTSRMLGERDILLISNEQLYASSDWKRSITIQHGIYWDLPVQYYTRNALARRFGHLYKAFDNWRNVRRIRPHRNVVCVDHAYPTWLRAITDTGADEARLWIIPNNAGDQFFGIAAPPDDGTVAILFARRFIRIRCTRQFARVARRLVEAFPHVRITLCGDGPDGGVMREILPESSRVKYRRADHSDMPSVLREHHVTVVPSLGSEGTSFSVTEGLAAGRAVVASAVGGIPNVILDRFNGLLVQPGDEEQLYRALGSLVESPELRARLSEGARQSSRAQLHFDEWARRWREVIETVASDP